MNGHWPISGIATCGPGPRGSARAVTLPEIMVVVLLMGLLMALALPRLANSAVWGSEGEAAAR